MATDTAMPLVARVEELERKVEVLTRHLLQLMETLGRS